MELVRVVAMDRFIWQFIYLFRYSKMYNYQRKCENITTNLVMISTHFFAALRHGATYWCTDS
jgi:hypothetical protein